MLNSTIEFFNNSNNYPIKFWIKTPFSGHHEKEKLLYKNSVILLILYVITINFEKITILYSEY
ncbi:hypothetical protein LEP1GSC124_3757 [Leptospira interrogans serovar Pyrogenes str. 200701872]|uniref:Uncharacterized protein n=1 Tax=Leptospira interrogans serovar Pyrogenes str. 200701872 TaxID=1193029 RepID=M6ZVG4_LEPIR|nr:hypothetical protein LEP1GSC124_3757 [Leptospira interrogans serovar Pyrogenes str. 200701872]